MLDLGLERRSEMRSPIAIQTSDARGSLAGAPATERRYDVDWLRVVAVFSVIALHSAVIFSFGLFNVKHTQNTLSLDTIVIFLTAWIIPLLFVLAGAATKFALDRRKPSEYRAERIKRLIVPGTMWFILPLAIAVVFGWDFLFQLPGNPRLGAVVGTGHLWFIFYLFIFSLVALPLFVFLRKPAGQRAISWLASICEKPGVIFLLAIPLMGITLQDSDNDLLKFFYLFYFIYGFIIFSDARFGRAIEKQAWYSLAAGVALVVVMVYVVETNMPLDGNVSRVIQVFGRWFLVLAFLGLGSRYLNRTNRVLHYLSEASYPIYILHYGITALVGYYLAGLDWPVELKYFAILSLSIAATVLAYDLLVKRTNVTRFLFGMKPKRAVAPAMAIQSEQEVAA
jgi:glucan biosynthesis protein C